ISVLTIITSNKFNAWDNVKDLFIMIGGGLGIGILVGVAFSFLISEGKYGIFHSFAPIMSLVAVATTYILAESVGGSGYMATFVAGLICGNKK
ncbi:cation:proton antiporter domain-containing protein, partial [Streptococcus pyogenes]